MSKSHWIAEVMLLGCLTGAAGCVCTRETATVHEVQSAPVAQNPAMSLEEIAELSRKGSSPQTIINLINSSGSTYVLGAEHVTWLKQQGVANAVIEYMQTHTSSGTVVGGAPPPALVRPAAVAYPYPPPPPYAYPMYAYPPPYGYPYPAYGRVVLR